MTSLHLPGLEPMSGAEFSECGLYRYKLWRVWNPTLPVLVVCMLNPSVADANNNDPTVRRCIGFAKSLGYGGLIVLNIFAFRATDPVELLKAESPIGLRNDQVILDVAKKHDHILAAWGAADNGIRRARADYVIHTLKQEGVKIYCLGTTKHGHPRHPLYVKSDQQMEPFHDDHQVD